MSMSFTFADIASGLSSASERGVNVQDGPELTEIQTDQLGFTGVNGEAKVRILPQPWPADDLPIPSASLLSVASSQGLIAAAGPDGLVLARTDDVRKAIQEVSQEDIRTISPLMTLPYTRLAQVAFTADESALILSRQETGGLIVYEVDQLTNGDTQPSLQIETESKGLKIIATNPAITNAYHVACVTLDGDLLLADLAKGALTQTSDGIVLAKNVSSVSWSNKGKQLVAGLLDGTALQLKPDGVAVARIPKSTSIPDDMHISAISWLENDIFFVIYTPSNASTEDGIPPSEYFIITRANTDYKFSRLPEILPPFGMPRVPTFHFLTRLRGWEPHITDLVLLSSTSATDVGVISKANQALSNSEPVIDTFTMTAPDDDTRRAALPLSDGQETSPIGMALDLSATNGVVNPIPADPEIEETIGPVPNVMVLNNEGVLCSWWIIYNDSVRQRTTYSGFKALDTMKQVRAAAATVTSPAPDSTMSPESAPSVPSQVQPQPMAEAKSTFGQGTASTSSPFSNTSTGFNTTASGSAFGTGSAFGSTSKIGSGTASWTSTGFSNTTSAAASTSSAFGKSSFGTTAFGTPSGLGSGFGTSSASFGQSATPAAPAFGQSGFGAGQPKNLLGPASSSASPFGSAGASGRGSGFSSFAGTGGFTNTESAKAENKGSGFGQFSRDSFGQNSSPLNAFGKAGGGSSFSQPGSSSFQRSTPFGTTTYAAGFGGSSSFKLDSSFKGDGTAKDDLPKTSEKSSFGFGSGLGNLLNEDGGSNQLSPTHNREEEMDDDDTDDENVSGSDTTSTNQPARDTSRGDLQGMTEPVKSMITPPSTISQTKSTPAQPVSGLFGNGSYSSTTPETTSGLTSWSFANTNSTTPKEPPAPSNPIFGTSLPQQVNSDSGKGTATMSLPGDQQLFTQPPKSNIASKMNTVTSLPENEHNLDSDKTTEPPLPPDPYSRPDFQAGDTSMSSINSSKPDDAPMPPDFLPAKKPVVSKAEETALPDADDGEDDEFSSDFEDSGEDVTHDISLADEGDDEHDGEHDEDDDDDDDAATEHVQTTPESSSKGENTTQSIASPTGGLFTKVSSNHPSSKPARALFGEIGTSAPTFPPPNPQESPRSPSPVRQLLPHDTLRPDSRSVSAPVRARSAIEQRKFEYLQSSNATQAAQVRQEEAARERARLDALSRAQEQAKANEMQSLEDDEDQRIQHELNQPVQPSEKLDAFITYEPTMRGDSNKVDIPGQIERLYQDINSMIYTLGINARSLDAFMTYQKNHQQNQSWPTVLQSETPLDTLNDEWFLQDIERLREGFSILDHELKTRSINDVATKLEICQNLLSTELADLKAKTMALRKSIYAKRDGQETTAALSAEQSAVQQDLRKAASTVQTSLISVEDGLSLLRARISDSQPADLTGKRKTAHGTSPRKPTVEAVTNTIAKMTSMAEKRSADVDVLEGQLKKLGLHGRSIQQQDKTKEPSTPQRNRTAHFGTPGSEASSAFYTPNSTNPASARSTRSNGGSNSMVGLNNISAEDKSRWLSKAKRKKDVASALKKALDQRQTRISVQ